MKRCNMLNMAVIVMLMCSPAAWAVELSISNINPSTYGISYNNLGGGKKVYIDRDYTYSSGPLYVVNKTFIQSANDDKYSTDDSFLTFTINQACAIYVAHDDSITPKPFWLNSFADTGDNVTSNNPETYSLYKKDFAAGTVTLGGNAGDGSSSMYTVVVIPLTNEANGPSPANNAAGVPSNHTVLKWSAGIGAISHDVYFGTSQSDVASAGRLAGDIDGEGYVNISDLSILAAQWLTNGSVSPSADIEFSGKVDFDDFAALAADWHQTPDAAFKGNQSGTTYNPGVLVAGTTYYWRIDEVKADGTTTLGEIWTFTVGGPVFYIMPLGDSITQGYTTWDNYRHHLWGKLQTNGYTNINFVGSHQTLAYDVVDTLVFDKDHEGHGGWTTDQIYTGGPAAGGTGNLTIWLNGLQAADELPDIVLMHLGTNDSYGTDQTVTINEMKTIINILRNYNPNVTVLLARIIPYPPNTTNINSLNNLISTVMDGYETATSQVIVVDHNTGFNSSLWLADGLHPNATGAAWMSDQWYAALTPILSLP